jgi:UDP-N-acetylglucosamine:LPS N-acetylglucosamine transferase
VGHHDVVVTECFAVLVAGGTGGHVYPAIAVADALVARGHEPATLRFVTDQRDVARAALDRTDYARDELPIAHGLERGGGLAHNLGVVVRATRATATAGRVLRAHRPRVVVGFGAYVALPVVVAARARRLPVVVHEQNGVPGLANRVAVRLGARAAVSLPGTALPEAILTGNPVRPDITVVEREPVSPPLVAFVGASLGAGVLNRTALDVYDRWRDRGDVQIRHVTGARFYDECRAALDALRRPGDALAYDLVDYEHDMAGLYTDAAVVVARAGGSVAELAAAGVPSVLVPWSGAADDHQTANARAFAEAGAAIHVREAECDGARVASLLDHLLADPDRLAAMALAARTLAHPDAADEVAALAEAIAR